MKVQLKSINYYFLTCDTNGKRKNHMMNTFKDYSITEVNPILGIHKNQSGPTGFSRMIDIGLRNQDRSLAFQPFVIMEDDCSKFREFPEYIEIPDNTDILYIGLSKSGTYKYGSNTKDIHKVYMEEVNSDIVRIYNMLSLHGIIICSASGALAIQKAMMEGYFSDKIWDLYTTYIQPYYNVYALKIPLVYQDKNLGGAEAETKITIEEFKSETLPEDHHHPCVSVITCKNI